MNTNFRLLAAALFLASTADSFAQAESAPAQLVEITASTEALTAARVVIERGGSGQIFTLPNGRRAAFDADGEALQLRYRNRNITVNHDGHGAFVSSGGQLRVVFQLDGAGDPNTVRMTMPSDWY